MKEGERDAAGVLSTFTITDQGRPDGAGDDAWNFIIGIHREVTGG